LRNLIRDRKGKGVVSQGLEGGGYICDMVHSRVVQVSVEEEGGGRGLIRNQGTRKKEKPKGRETKKERTMEDIGN
jgi:hypothetical protein